MRLNAESLSTVFRFLIGGLAFPVLAAASLSCGLPSVVILPPPVVRPRDPDKAHTVSFAANPSASENTSAYRIYYKIYPFPSSAVAKDKNHLVGGDDELRRGTASLPGGFRPLRIQGNERFAKGKILAIPARIFDGGSIVTISVPPDPKLAGNNLASIKLLDGKGDVLETIIPTRDAPSDANARVPDYYKSFYKTFEAKDPDLSSETSRKASRVEIGFAAFAIGLTPNFSRLESTPIFVGTVEFGVP